MRQNFSSGAKWEDIVGYSRAVKVNNQIFITGTVAVDENSNLIGGDSAYEQTKFILQKIEKVLHQCGATMNDVVRTRMFVTDISRWEDYGRAHGEFFKDIKPCTTMVEVSKLIAPEYLIEIEVDAVIEFQATERTNIFNIVDQEWNGKYEVVGSYKDNTIILMKYDLPTENLEGRSNLLSIDLSRNIVWFADKPRENYKLGQYDKVTVSGGRIIGWYGGSMYVEIDPETGKVLLENFVK